MITVVGEALMDIVVEPDGSTTTHTGGASFNVARTIARLGGACRFLGRLSGDGFGRRLRSELDRLGISLVVGEATSAPTTLAVAELDAAGAAEYTFYLEGTSAAQLNTDDLPSGVLEDSQVVVFGGLGIVVEPIATTLRGLVAEVTEHVTVMFDVNCRRSAIRDVDAYRRTVGDYLRHVDIVKVSVDDVKLLAPDSEPRAAARRMLESGPAAVLLTDGPNPVTIITTASERTVAVPDVAVTDSVGAGDAFVAGFLMTWSARPHRPRPLDPDELAHATSSAVLVASAACRVPGAGLPDNVVWRPAAANTGRQ